MWEKIKRLETIVALIVGIIAIAGSIAFPQLLEWVVTLFSSFISSMFTPIQIPLIIFLLLVAVMVVVSAGKLRNYIKSRRGMSKPVEPTHETYFKGHIIRYVID
jgi:H+/Cl- antiporter ClcA